MPWLVSHKGEMVKVDAYQIGLLSVWVFPGLMSLCTIKPHIHCPFKFRSILNSGHLETLNARKTKILGIQHTSTVLLKGVNSISCLIQQIMLQNFE